MYDELRHSRIMDHSTTRSRGRKGLKYAPRVGEYRTDVNQKGVLQNRVVGR